MSAEEYEPSPKRGGIIVLILIVLVIAGVVALINSRSPSPEEREVAAIDACKEAVEGKAPTEWRKLWQDDKFAVTGEPDRLTVTGEFATKDSVLRPFTCRLDGETVTTTEVAP